MSVCVMDGIYICTLFYIIVFPEFNWHTECCCWQFWFAMLTGFSGQVVFERWSIGLYNVVSYYYSC